MNLKRINTFKSLLFILIPLLTVFSCLAFKVAKGEIVEEIVFGIIAGVVLDIVVGTVLFCIKKMKK